MRTNFVRAGALAASLTAGTAIFVAACNDEKVSILPPSPLSVHSVVVVPLTPTINVGGHVLLTASVNADSGVATAVAWSSADATKAMVDANGDVTGVAVTTALSICATSTADASKKGCAAVTVAP